ncbi:MAG TPA: tellurium resistance protein TerC [Herpetosiphonaceae bacterium]
MDWNIIPIILLLIFLEGVLSIDNAAVLGAMVAHLPEDTPVPWPNWLRGLGHALDRTLGGQQGAALKVGLLGAYLGRFLMLGLAFIIVEQTWVLILGACYLFWLGVNHFGNLHQHIQEEAGAAGPRARPASFWKTVLVIEIADLAFSLDNVVVAVQLDPQKRLWVVALGVGIGILVMRFAAGIFTKLIEWEPNLEHAAFALLLAIGTEAMLKGFFHIETPHALKFVISMVILGMTIAISRLVWLGWLRRILHLGLPLAAGIQTLVTLLLAPVRMLWGLLMSPFSSAKSGA